MVLHSLAVCLTIILFSALRSKAWAICRGQSALFKYPSRANTVRCESLLGSKAAPECLGCLLPKSLKLLPAIHPGLTLQPWLPIHLDIEEGLVHAQRTLRMNIKQLEQRSAGADICI